MYKHHHLYHHYHHYHHHHCYHYHHHYHYHHNHHHHHHYHFVFLIFCLCLQSVNDTFNITDSFNAPVQHQTPAQMPSTGATLKKPPKWLRRPCGASFGVRFGNYKLCKIHGTGIAKTLCHRVTNHIDLLTQPLKPCKHKLNSNYIHYCK